MRQEISWDLLLLGIEFVLILLSVLALERLILLLFLLLAGLAGSGFRLWLTFALLPFLVLLLDELVLSLLGLLLALVPDTLEVAVYLLVSLGSLFCLAPDHFHGCLLLFVEGVEIRPTGQDLNCLKIPIVARDVQSCVLSMLVPLLRVSMMV